MKRTNLLSLLLGLSVLGLVDAWYLAQAALTGLDLTCNIGGGLDGCNVVAQSAYSHFFGIPLGVYGVVFYGLFLFISAVLVVRRIPAAERVLTVLGVFGVLISAYFMYVQYVLIKAMCIYCLGSAVIAVLLCLITIILVRQKEPQKAVDTASQ